MAQYNIDLAVAIKNSNKLIQLRKELKAATDEQRNFNKLASEKNNKAVATFNKLNAQLSRAKSLLNKTAYGTASFNKAAKALVNVEKEHNHQLKEKERLLNRLRTQADPNFIVRHQRKLQIQENIRQNRALRFTNVNPGRPAVVGDYGQAGGRIGPAQVLANSQGGFLAFNQIAKKIEVGVKGIGKSSSQTARVLSSQAASAAFQDLPFGVKGGQIGPAQSNLFNRLGFGRNANPRGAFAMQGGSSARIRSSLQSGLIGGGFPLLFGGGGAGAAAGGLGGLAGGALSAGGGFALSIAATALVSQIQEVRKFRKAVRELNRDLLASGAATQVSRKQIKELGKALNITKEEAIETLAQFNKFSDAGFVNLAKIFGTREMFDANVGLNDFASTLQRIQTLSEELTLETEFEAYKILAKEGSIAANEFIRSQFLIRQQYDNFASFFASDLKNFQNLGVSGFSANMGFSNNAGIFGRGFFQDSYNKDFAKILDYYIQNNEEIQKILTDPTSYKNNDLTNILSRESINKIDNILKPFLQDTEKVKKLLEELPEDFQYSTQFAEQLVEELSDVMKQLQFLEEFQAPQEELRNLLDPLRQILDLSTELKLGFEDAFKGIIKGTMSVGDAFRSMLNRIADYFLDYAAQTAALGLQNLFLSPFKDRFTPDTSIFDRPGVKELLDGNRANGGNVIGGKSYLVGERGPELFTPGATGTITANDAIGGASIVVNVDASGTSVEGNEANGEELGRLIGAVVQSELIKEKRPGGLLS